MGRKTSRATFTYSRRPSAGLTSPSSGDANANSGNSGTGLHSDAPFNFEFSRALHELQPAVVVYIDEDELHRLKAPPVKELPALPPLPQEPPRKDVTGQEQDAEEESKPNRGIERRWAYKNVIGVSLSVFFVFTAFLGLQNLQSSINSSGGVGLGSLAILYVFFMGAGFLSPGLLKIMGTKYSLLAAYICQLIYTLANFYPSWFTLAPASLLLGAASALLWAAASSHIVQVAVYVAPQLKKDQNHLISSFTGIFFCFFQVAQIPGNLASSLVLFPYNKANKTSTDDFDLDSDAGLASNDSELDTSTCQHSESYDFDLKYLYVLDSVYVMFVVMGIITLMTLVSRLDIPQEKTVSSACHRYGQFFKKSLKELFSVMTNYKMVLIAPVSVFNGLEQSFLFGIFTETFITDCFGTYQVGFTLVSYGVTSAIMSATYGRIVKYIPRMLIFLIGGALNLTLLIFLSMWTPTPSYLVIYLFAILWGAADAVWNTMTASLTGIHFPSRSETAYSAQRIWLALGLTVGFVLAEFLPLQGCVWFTLSMLVLALTAVVVIEVKTQCRCWHHYKCSSVATANTASIYSSGSDVVKGLPDHKEDYNISRV